MRARDLMTTTLVTLPPAMPLEAVARILSERGISGAPVVDPEGRLLGIVTEGDLIRRIAAPGDKPESWLRNLIGSASEQAARYARTRGRRAEDVMTRDLWTAEEDTPIERIAAAMEERGFRRVPVLRDGKLVGIVTRADLIRTLLEPAERFAADAPDELIRRRLSAAMRREPWVDTYFIFPEVQDGRVTFHGFCRSEEVRRALRVMAEGIPGVKSVELDLHAPPPFVAGAS